MADLADRCVCGSCEYEYECGVMKVTSLKQVTKSKRRKGKQWPMLELLYIINHDG